MKKIIGSLICFFLGFIVFGQEKVTISGFIYDKNTGEVLIGATIYENYSQAGTVSNEYGFYNLTFNKQDSLKLYISYLGYKQLSVTNPENKDLMNFHLTPSGLELDVVEVVLKERSIVDRNETGVIRLEMRDIKTLPNLFGEVDIIKAYQLTPGVQSGGEAKSNLYVRGGSPDQNLILLDDVPLYYVAHFGGFFSIFNADAINDVKLIKGGFPARYGSRLSSVLDIRMKEGNMQSLCVQGTVGLLSSKISVEAPIIKNKMSFIISARKNLVPVFRILDAGIAYNFYDLNVKLNYRLSPKNIFFVSYYRGDDLISVKHKDNDIKHHNTVKWGNQLISLRWNRIYNNNLFSNFTLSNTHYRYKNRFEYNAEMDSISKKIDNVLLTGINDIRFNGYLTYKLNSKFDFRFGINSIYHTFIPNDETFQFSNDSINIDESYSSVTNALENAVYIENNLNFKKIEANIGVRYSSYLVKNTYYNLFEPRILLNWILTKEFALKYSFSKMNQYIHLLTYSGSGMPSDYWMPTNENVKPEESLQNSLCIAKTFNENKYELILEAYYKTLNNQIRFTPGKSFLGNLDNWENVIEKNGTGENYGIELFVQKKTGRLFGWVGATVAKAERKFENLNNGKAYPFNYDRLLDLSIVANYKIKENITFSSTWTYGTGYPVTLATEHYKINDYDIFIYDEINSFKMRDYHRLDVAVNFRKKTNWGERTWTISIFNLYNRMNPYYYYYDEPFIGSSFNNGAITAQYGNLTLYQRSLFSIFPSFSYSFKF